MDITHELGETVPTSATTLVIVMVHLRMVIIAMPFWLIALIVYLEMWPVHAIKEYQLPRVLVIWQDILKRTLGTIEVLGQISRQRIY
jgi:hypothetical protein